VLSALASGRHSLKEQTTILEQDFKQC